MKRYNYLLATITMLTIGLASCVKNNNPENVAKDFYEAINSGAFDKAKELSTPTTIEKIELMQKFNSSTELATFKIMEVSKKESYTEGDTIKIDYKVADAKHKMKLIYTDGCFKVIWSDDLMQIRKIIISSIDLFNYKIGAKQYEKNDESKVEIKKYFNGCRFVISDVIISFVNYNGVCFGIAYDKEKNFSPIEGGNAWMVGENAWSFGTELRTKYNIILSGKSVNLLPEPKTTSFYHELPHNLRFEFSNEGIVGMKSLVVQNDEAESKYEVDKLRKIEGVFRDVDDFSDCKVLPQ